MATVAELLVKIGADSQGLRKELAASQRQIKRAFGPEALEAAGAASGLLAGLVAAMGAAGLASVKMAGDVAASTKAFETLLGDGQKAKDFLEDLQQFAAETPFEMKGLQDTAKKLLAFKFAAQDIIPMMSVIGDAAGMLGSGQEGIDGMTMAISQMMAKGRVQGEELLQLAERGVNAYQYLADSMGISIPEVLKKVSAGEVSAQEGINAILLGMQKDFKGGMEKQAQEIPGLFSTIKDNVAAIMREAGTKIADSLNIKGIMQGLADSLGGFGAYIKQSGINQTLKDLVPKELSLAIFAVAGALTAAAIPAMVRFGISVWAAMAPLAPFIAGGAAIGAVAWVIWQAWTPISDLFANTFKSILYTVIQIASEIEGAIYTFVRNCIQTLQPLFNLFGLQAAADNWIGAMQNRIDRAASFAQSAAASAQESVQGVSNAWAGLKDGVMGGVESVSESARQLKKTFEGLTNTGTPGGSGSSDVGGGKAASAAAKEWEKLENKANQVSESIEREWVQTTKTQLEQLEIWRAEQISSLEETAGANENYERDMERVDAVYSARRTKILQQEAKEARETFKSIRDGYLSIQKEILLGDLTGADKDVAGKAFNYADKIKGMQDYFDKIAQDYEVGNQKQKQDILNTLDQLGIAYEKSADDRLNFEKTTAEASAAYQKQYMQEVTDYYATCKDIQSNIDAAYNANSMAMLQATLTAENAMRLSDYEAQKSMMETYQEAMIASQMTSTALMASMYSTAFSGLQTAFSNIFMNIKNADDAMKEFGKTMLKSIADFYAKKLAGMVTTSLFGKQALATETKLSVAAAAVTAAAWAKAAAMVSLASFGANAAPAMAGITETVGLSMALATVPGLADGGITTGPTLAMIGEGKYKEAVLPLNKRMFEKMGLTGGGTGAQITQNNYGNIYTEVDYDQMQEDLGRAVGTALMGA